jgi:hypothetical protein
VLVVRDGVGDQRLLVDCLIPGYFAKLTIASASSASDPVDACEIRRTARRVVRCSGPAFEEERRHAGVLLPAQGTAWLWLCTGMLGMRVALVRGRPQRELGRKSYK